MPLSLQPRYLGFMETLSKYSFIFKLSLHAASKKRTIKKTSNSRLKESKKPKIVESMENP